MLALQPQLPSFSWTILLALLLIFSASMTMYVLVVLRWTTRRHWVSLSEWASAHRMKLGRLATTDLPSPINRLQELNAAVRLRVGDARTTIVQFQTYTPGTTHHENIDGSDTTTGGSRWNVLIRRAKRTHAPAALRPEHVTASVIDLFDLTTFHSLGTARFSALAVDFRTAQQLSQSPARALLPPDVGLLIVGESIVLDFSTRPFDPVELDRMLSVIDQIDAAI